MKLNEIEQDSLKEFFNISVGKTADVMSKIVNKEIFLSVPEIVILPREDVTKLQNINSIKVCAISQHFRSAQTGYGVAFLVFPENKSSEIVRLMLGNEFLENEMTDQEDEAMLEIGNMVLNSCLGAIDNLARVNMDLKLPTFFRGQIQDLLPSEKNSQEIQNVVAVYVNYQISGHNINGYLFFLMELNLVEFLIQILLKQADL